MATLRRLIARRKLDPNTKTKCPHSCRFSQVKGVFSGGRGERVDEEHGCQTYTRILIARREKCPKAELLRARVNTSMNMIALIPTYSFNMPAIIPLLRGKFSKLVSKTLVPRYAR